MTEAGTEFQRIPENPLAARLSSAIGSVLEGSGIKRFKKNTQGETVFEVNAQGKQVAVELPEFAEARKKLLASANNTILFPPWNGFPDSSQSRGSMIIIARQVLKRLRIEEGKKDGKRPQGLIDVLNKDQAGQLGLPTLRTLDIYFQMILARCQEGMALVLSDEQQKLMEVAREAAVASISKDTPANERRRIMEAARVATEASIRKSTPADEKPTEAGIFLDNIGHLMGNPLVRVILEQDRKNGRK